VVRQSPIRSMVPGFVQQTVVTVRVETWADSDQKNIFPSATWLLPRKDGGSGEKAERKTARDVIRRKTGTGAECSGY